MKRRRTYSELIKRKTFEDRFEYLNLRGSIGCRTFGGDRHINQMLYQSSEWQSFRHEIIVRDRGCDLAVVGREIYGPIHIHHIEPITKEMIANNDPLVFDPENVVCVTPMTHKAIHYGSYESTVHDYEPRRPNDTTLWKE